MLDSKLYFCSHLTDVRQDQQAIEEDLLNSVLTAKVCCLFFCTRDSSEVPKKKLLGHLMTYCSSAGQACFREIWIHAFCTTQVLPECWSVSLRNHASMHSKLNKSHQSILLPQDRTRAETEGCFWRWDERIIITHPPPFSLILVNSSGVHNVTNQLFITADDQRLCRTNDCNNNLWVDWKSTQESWKCQIIEDVWVCLMMSNLILANLVWSMRFTACLLSKSFGPELTWL